MKNQVFWLFSFSVSTKSSWHQHSCISCASVTLFYLLEPFQYLFLLLPSHPWCAELFGYASVTKKAGKGEEQKEEMHFCALTSFTVLLTTKILVLPMQRVASKCCYIQPALIFWHIWTAELEKKNLCWNNDMEITHYCWLDYSKLSVWPFEYSNSYYYWWIFFMPSKTKPTHSKSFRINNILLNHFDCELELNLCSANKSCMCTLTGCSLGEENCITKFSEIQCLIAPQPSPLLAMLIKQPLPTTANWTAWFTVDD